ncbi:maleylpyruvate isomerase N-terminal domain-containing protein [Sulfitobacter sp. F26169L]|uniref:maleylpyruvate isomerase N-terminal domain-containing protein n=1 Tax=Sulfitobacter sp. F26169L TaxID=2996015 RepID=UPI002260AA18|nr:maleylpyruvate isomerase N-terminal domain-containing protein [Sulfitobacter sp. F26169L]MCX7565967.1 maleylpyruvate isomerase N-terminal domain-containing protein [Sulfitobacter sp. F26169L]
MSLSPSDKAARDALRARQGKGARYDAPDAPHGDLLLARRGAAYFARKLGELKDDDLGAPSLRDGWTRRHLIAHAGYHARALALLVESARTGIECTTSTTQQERHAEIDLGATLPSRALRGLVFHATIHLDVEWRDLTDAGWDTPLVLQDGTLLTARDTPRLRAREIWQCAIDLGNGGRASDIPRELEK